MAVLILFSVWCELVQHGQACISCLVLSDPCVWLQGAAACWRCQELPILGLTHCLSLQKRGWDLGAAQHHIAAALRALGSIAQSSSGG